MKSYKFLISFVVLFLLSFSPAMADDGFAITDVTINTTSYHFDEGGREHNSNNYGFGLIAGKNDSVVSYELDVFRNSRPETSYTVAAMVNRKLGTTGGMFKIFGKGIDYGGSLGIASYLKSSKHERVEIPVIRAYADFPFIRKSILRVGAHPKFLSMQFVVPFD